MAEQSDNGKTHPAAGSGLKRLFDIIAASSGLLALSPIMVVAALAIRKQMGSPVIFSQDRPGLSGRSFRMYKFRTMKPAVEGEKWYRTDENRLTSLGRFLRKYSIDELPELYNVLLGNMSIVGPRPLLMEYLEKYTKTEMRRHEVKPGITGLAQVSGRQNIPFSKRLELDVQYVENWNVLLDAHIVLKTVTEVFKSTGVVSGQDLEEVDDIGLSADKERKKRGAVMFVQLDEFVLRLPEKRDVQAIWTFKNDPEIANLLGGYCKGYSLEGIERWIEFHNGRDDEVVWAIAEASSDACIGHVGLYRVDHRIRSAEFAILLGDRDHWGKQHGRKITEAVVRYGMDMLNLNRISLSVLENNERALRLYEKIGFVEEGRLRQSQFKNGQYLDLVCMSVLREEWEKN